MKKSYISHVRRPYYYLLLLLAMVMPRLGLSQVTIGISPSTDQNFGQVALGSTSAVRTFDVTTTGTSRPTRADFYDASQGDFSNSFEGSTDGSNYSTSVPLPSAPGTFRLYIRFRPTFIGSTTTTDGSEALVLQRGNVGAVYASLNLVGEGIAGTPSIAVNPTALGFGSRLVNTTSASDSVTVTADNLDTDITVTSSNAAFKLSTSATGPFVSSLNITSIGGSVRTKIYVRFSPTTPGALAESITLSSTGATSKMVSVSGTGTLPTPLLIATPGTLSFTPSVAVGSNSPSQFFTVSGQDLQGNVTITPPSGFQIRTGTNLFTINPITLTVTNGILSNTQIDVRFSPVAAQQYTSVPVAVTSPNATTRNVLVSGEGTAAPTAPTINLDPTTVMFGTVTSSGSPNTRSFQVNATGLNDNLVLVPNSPNILIRNAAVGGAFQNTPLNIAPANGVVPTQTIEVQLVATVAQGPFSETITIGSPGTTPTPPVVKTVTVTANNTSGAISDISLVDPNPSGTDYTFVTRPSTISASKTILVSGTNLLQDLVIEPIGTNASYFQVSNDNVTFSSRLTFTPNSSGNVTQRAVYIRFVPGTAATTVTAAVRATSSPASYKEVSVSGISEPTLRLDRVIGNFGNDLVKNLKSFSKDVRVDGFLLGGTTLDLRFPAEVSTSAQFEFSLDGGTRFVKDTTLALDANGNISRLMKVRYAPTRVGSAVQELQYRNESLNNGNFFSGTSGFAQATGFAIAIEPTAQSTAYIVRNPSRTSATISFNLNTAPAGTSYGVNRLVIGTTSYSQLPPRLFPADKQNFNPGSTDANSSYVYGSGTPIESNTNTFVVFSGGSTSFTVSNLDPSLTYYYYSFEFNDDGVLQAENYRVPNNEPLSPLPVELVAFTAQLRSEKVYLNWTTASERNNSGFEIQRTQNEQEFQTILTREGNGTTTARSTYEAVDNQPLKGVSYYRLKQNDNDGKFAYSPVVVVRNQSLTKATFYPNPTSGKLTISLPQEQVATVVKVRVTDLSGREVKTLMLPATGEIDLSALQAGTYLITVGSGESQITRRVVKE